VNVFTRGVRNALRNSIRTTSIVIVVGLSIGLALAMLVARASVQDKIASIKSAIGNSITITPAGTKEFQGGGEPLTTEQINKVTTITNVTKVIQTLSDRLTTENSSLVSAIEAGSLGTRGANNSGIKFMAPAPSPGGPAAQPTIRTFSPPIIVTGTTVATDPSLFGNTTATFISGKPFDASKDEHVAIVGRALAEKNALTVGSSFAAYNTSIKVAGIYDAGTTFLNSGLIMPLSTLQRLSDQKDSVTGATVTVNSVDNVETVTTAIQTILGTTADVTNNQEATARAIEPLESVRTISTFSLLGALVAGAVIILLTMVMIVRERRREIGVFKAIGASNARIMLQFVSEAVTLTLLGTIAGIIIGAAAASPITNALVSTSTSSSQTANESGKPMPSGGGKPVISMHAFGGNTLTHARTVQASVGWDIIVYGLVAALVIAITGSALPAFFIAKIRPAEVMRAE
jgi:putative ABC transport system permease protein